MFLQHGLVYRYFPFFSKNVPALQLQAPLKAQKAEHLRKATQKTFAYVGRGLWGLFVEVVAAQASALSFMCD